MITGKDLIKLGYKPGKWFREALNTLNESEYISQEEMIDYLDSMVPPPPIDPFDEPKPYFKFITASNKDEEANIEAVVATMNEVMKTPTVTYGAIMPDACPTGTIGQIPVGGIVATENAIHPAMHSADVCCSVMTTNLGKIDPKLVLDTAMGITRFGAGGRKEHGGWSDLLYDNKSLTDMILGNYYTKDYIEKAAMHLGTQGDGNHFLFVGISEQTGETHLVTHHGSRGFGAAVYKKGMNEAEKFRRELSPNTLPKNAWLPYNTVEGKLYWEALQIVREWTKLNHEVIHNKIGNQLKVQYQDRFWNEHNFVFKKGDTFFHAKGATPLADELMIEPQQGLRLIPLNMSQPILVVKGNGTFGFAPHGAGRNFSRSEHKRRNGNMTEEQLFTKETEGLDVRFFSGKIDISELPSAYKNAEEVQRQIEEFGMCDIVDRILPYGCIMAGAFEKHY